MVVEKDVAYLQVVRAGVLAVHCDLSCHTNVSTDGRQVGIPTHSAFITCALWIAYKIFGTTGSPASVMESPRPPRLPLQARRLRTIIWTLPIMVGTTGMFTLSCNIGLD